MNYKKGSFTKYVDEIKSRVESGEISQEDATYFILAKVATIFEDMGKRVSNEQFMKEQTMHGANIN